MTDVLGLVGLMVGWGVSGWAYAVRGDVKSGSVFFAMLLAMLFLA